jgi:hypothetical protein
MADTTAVPNVQLAMPDINAIQTIRLPPAFCIESYNMAGRAGYRLFGTIEEEAHPVNVCIIKAKKHNDMYFQIINDTAHILHNRTTWRQTLARKGQGRINRLAKWRHTGTSLKHDDIEYPVIRIKSYNTITPAIQNESFIPIINNNQATRVVTPPAPAAPVPQAPRIMNLPTRTVPPPLQPVIDVIPQHAIKLILLGALIEGEICPITTNDITLENGAVTTCFHLFDKDAINRWLNSPASRRECPVCKDSCVSYSMNVTPA